MSITVKCKCGAALTVAVEPADGVITCSMCGRRVRIPGDADAAGVQDNKIRWPRTILGPLALAGTGLAVLLAAVIAAMVIVPSLTKGPEQGEPVTARDYINPEHGYRFVIPAAWMITDENPDDLVLRGRSDSSVIEFAVKGGANESRAFLKALLAELEREPGFKEERRWSTQGGLNHKPFQLVYSYDGEGGRWRAIVRVFKLEQRWLVMAYRAQRADYYRGLSEFDDAYRSLKTLPFPYGSVPGGGSCAFCFT